MSGRGKGGVGNVPKVKRVRRMMMLEEYEADDESTSDRELTEQDKTICDLWKRIETYWTKEYEQDEEFANTLRNPIIDDEAFRVVEKKLKFPLPDDFKQFFRVHNGQDIDEYEREGTLFGHDIKFLDLGACLEKNEFLYPTCDSCCFAEADYAYLLQQESIQSKDSSEEEEEEEEDEDEEEEEEEEIQIDFSTILGKRNIKCYDPYNEISSIRKLGHCHRIPSWLKIEKIDELIAKRKDKEQYAKSWNYVGALTFGMAEYGDGSYGFCLMGFQHKEDKNQYGYEIGFWHDQYIKPEGFIPFNAGEDFFKLYPQSIAPFLYLSNPRVNAFTEWLTSFVHHLEAFKLTKHQDESKQYTTPLYNNERDNYYKGTKSDDLMYHFSPDIIIYKSRPKSATSIVHQDNKE